MINFENLANKGSLSGNINYRVLFRYVQYAADQFNQSMLDL